MGRKLGAVPLLGELGPYLTQCRLGLPHVAYLRAMWHLDPSSRLVTIDMSRKLGGCAPFWWFGPLSTQSRLGKVYLHTKWHLNQSSRLATIDMGRQLGAVSLFGGGWVPI